MRRGDTQTDKIELSGEQLTYRLRTSPRARRITLRLAARDGSLQVTAPPSVSRRQVQAFLKSQSGWIAQRRATLPAPVPFDVDQELPILGEPHAIRHCPNARRGVWLEPGALNVSGHRDHLPRRIEDFLRTHVRQQLIQEVRQRSHQLPSEARPLGRITVRDTTSRWGSCSSSGNLSFSWRLVFAPREVFDYVVVHELAHLVHLDHSRAYWRLVKDMKSDFESARAWLRREGSSLLRYGASP